MIFSDICKQKILIVIPAFNEEQTVMGVILGIKKEVDWDILVVDDNSIDATVDEAHSAGAMTISLPTRTGAWRAIQTGIRYAKSEKYNIVVTMDADGQHSAKSLKDLVKPILANQYDTAIGVCTNRANYTRKLTWKVFRKISGLSLEDITSGYRAYGASSINILLSPEATMLTFQDLGVLMLLSNERQKIVETEVVMFERNFGISKIYSSWIAIWVYLTQTLLLCIAKISMPWYRNSE